MATDGKEDAVAESEPGGPAGSGVRLPLGGCGASSRGGAKPFVREDEVLGRRTNGTGSILDDRYLEHETVILIFGGRCRRRTVR